LKLKIVESDLGLGVVVWQIMISNLKLPCLNARLSEMGLRGTRSKGFLRPHLLVIMRVTIGPASQQT
jgi:hypothetical protein